MNQKKTRLKIGSKEKEILKLIGGGVFVGLSLAIPNLPVVLEPFLKNRRARAQTKLILKQLEGKDLILLGGDKVCLTEKGRTLIENFADFEFKINTPKKWDGVWRIVAYDIPDEFKKERDYFRKRLQEEGFVKIQESLFAHPFDCKEEIAVFAHTLRISPFVIYMKADKLPNQGKLISSFRLEI